MKTSSPFPFTLLAISLAVIPFYARGESTVVRASAAPRVISTVLAKTIAQPQPLVPVQVNQIVLALPREIVAPLPHSFTHPLPGQIVRSLPGQTVSSLPGQIVRPLAGQIIPSLPGQILP